MPFGNFSYHKVILITYTYKALRRIFNASQVAGFALRLLCLPLGIPIFIVSILLQGPRASRGWNCFFCSGEDLRNKYLISDTFYAKSTIYTNPAGGKLINRWHNSFWCPKNPAETSANPGLGK
jgi:hypothetical protein